ncbi:GrrA/OscA1 family cyclophane-containing rSAM-modified RiPP [Desulfotomaculum copahuensis]|uniref:RSAM-associated Gly-rich repeat protein n=1 Tax=Desulfotomaculum copahuensis TaxID=1838280 RepID=A0A1B7LEQ7_9FIRM|nr:GrrA/OscA1 family cyclophane-containing rSAM-modified RiPP [Desulfotomaculum copahuensis]OAT81763.1 rSAM-associated Gly-rich repeat protein [Desulfotomaculum copahuensis]
MKKKLIAVLVVVLVLALAVPALAATVSQSLTPDQAKQINSLQQQMLNLRSQMVDKMVQFGQLTPEQGQQIKANIQSRVQYLQQNPGQAGYGPGFCGGYGMRGYGNGRGGWGPGGMMGGCWNNRAPSAPAPNTSSGN